MWCCKCGYGSECCKLQEVGSGSYKCPQCGNLMTDSSVIKTNPHKPVVKGAGGKKKKPKKKQEEFFEPKDPDASEIGVMDYSKGL